MMMGNVRNQFLKVEYRGSEFTTQFQSYDRGVTRVSGNTPCPQSLTKPNTLK